jgi:hypothetical protein
MLLALADKSASLQLTLGLAAPAFLGKRLCADPARVAADRLQGQRLTENNREVSSQPGLEGCIVDRSQDIGWQSIRKDIAPFAVTWTYIPSRSVTL